MDVVENDDWQPRPLIYIPRELLPEPPPSGCVLQLTLRDGRSVKGVSVDAKGMIYGVLVSEAVDSRLNPIDFSSVDIVAVARIGREIPEGYKFV